MTQRYANGHISATGDPIHFMFGSMVGFSRSADRMVLFLVTRHQIQVGGRPPSWIISNGHISQRLIRSTYIARIARSSLRQHSFLVYADIARKRDHILNARQEAGLKQ